MRNVTEELNQIPELYQLRHKHDTELPEMGFDYSSHLLDKTLSPVLYKNDANVEFLDKLSDMMVSLLDSVLPVRNIFYYTHSKYFNRHGR